MSKQFQFPVKDLNNLKMQENVLGYEIDALSVKDCVDDIFLSIARQNQGVSRCKWLACLNPHSYAVSLNDRQFEKALKNANWLVPDGSGIILASRLLNGRIRERVTGSDIFFGLHQRMNPIGGMSVFFLGASEETLAQIRQKMFEDYPNIRVVGTYSPPFRASYTLAEIDEMVGAINAVKPDVLWVGMTAPKQEKWIYENCERLNVRFAGAVGAVFDFYTGKVKRSHPVFQRLGLEWLPRLVQQPRRLWRRMFISAPIFLWHVVKARVSPK